VQENLGDPISKVTYFLGGPNPVITKLNFFTRNGRGYESDVYFCNGRDSFYDVYQG
jgi:hypothetical protein